mmetsp:Transcript_44021/g.93724  ORF Transcript_44021/g.93724 Transcript_44021/m.93724 type:complete len:333 (-) Transcript_44021:373-1371(-)
MAMTMQYPDHPLAQCPPLTYCPKRLERSSSSLIVHILLLFPTKSYYEQTNFLLFLSRKALHHLASSSISFPSPSVFASFATFVPLSSALANSNPCALVTLTPWLSHALIVATKGPSMASYDDSFPSGIAEGGSTRPSMMVSRGTSKSCIPRSSFVCRMMRPSSPSARLLSMHPSFSLTYRLVISFNSVCLRFLSSSDNLGNATGGRLTKSGFSFLNRTCTFVSSDVIFTSVTPCSSFTASMMSLITPFGNFLPFDFFALAYRLYTSSYTSRFCFRAMPSPLSRRCMKFHVTRLRMRSNDRSKSSIPKSFLVSWTMASKAPLGSLSAVSRSRA